MQSFARNPHPKYRACPITARSHPLAREFFELAARDNIAITDIAERAGLHHKTLIGWKHTSSPTVTALEAALNAIGYELVIFPRAEA